MTVVLSLIPWVESNGGRLLRELRLSDDEPPLEAVLVPLLKPSFDTFFNVTPLQTAAGDKRPSSDIFEGESDFSLEEYEAHRSSGEESSLGPDPSPGPCVSPSPCPCARAICDGEGRDISMYLGEVGDP